MRAQMCAPSHPPTLSKGEEDSKIPATTKSKIFLQEEEDLNLYHRNVPKARQFARSVALSSPSRTRPGPFVVLVARSVGRFGFFPSSRSWWLPIERLIFLKNWFSFVSFFCFVKKKKKNNNNDRNVSNARKVYRMLRSVYDTSRAFLCAWLWCVSSRKKRERVLLMKPCPLSQVSSLPFSFWIFSRERRKKTKTEDKIRHHSHHFFLSGVLLHTAPKCAPPLSVGHSPRDSRWWQQQQRREQRE